MYKLLLCWRYLCTRYIALASIISVTLGVAVMIVVNSVMSGFTTEMQSRIHAIISDVVFEARSLEGVPDAEWHKEQIRKIAGDQIEAMTATVVVPAMLNFRYGDNWITRQVQLIGIDEATQRSVSDFSTYLQHPDNRRATSAELFKLHETGYDLRDHNGGAEMPERAAMRDAGWIRRRLMAELQRYQRQWEERGKSPAPNAPVDPFAAAAKKEANAFDPAKEQHTGVILGIAMASYRNKTGEDRFLTLPGDDVKLTFPTAGAPPKAVSDNFTIVDFYESKMSEYDATFVFVPIRKLQELRGMIDPSSGVAMINSIAIKLKPGVDGNAVRDKLRVATVACASSPTGTRPAFAPEFYNIYTWRDKQVALLAAVQMETAILNVLLFMIIAVAGFGILAIFFMIVVEKTRDIGVLKSLGASGLGIMGIYLTYGLSLGLVGSGAGFVAGLLIVKNINAIANLLGSITGQKVFDPSIYYFYSIPTIIHPLTIAWIVAGAMAIAVLASVLPALRAALLHPVEALRYE